MTDLHIGDRVLFPVQGSNPDTSPVLVRGIITALSQRGPGYYQVALLEPATYYFALSSPPYRVWDGIPLAHLWPNWNEPEATAQNE